MGKGKVCFSLLELLVVMAVVMILVTWLSSSLNKMTERSRQVHCFGNLRAMGQTVGVYVENNDEVFMNHRRGNHFNWHDHLMDLGMKEESFRCQQRGSYWESRRFPGEQLEVVLETRPRTLESAHHRMPYGYNAFWLGYAPYGTVTRGP